MIYFDNASTSLPKPSSVLRALKTAANTLGNPSRGAHGASVQGLRTMLNTREAVSALFNVPSPMNVVFVLNATAALNMAISAIDGHIVTTAAEHNSLLRPLYKRGNFSITRLDSKGRLDLADLNASITDKTKAIAMCHGSNLTGNVFDIQAIGKICKSKGLALIIDAAQTAGLIPIDMKEWGISALCVSGHKSLYGVQGLGLLCLNEGFLPKPLTVGGSGFDSFSPNQPNQLPDFLEAGTQNMPAIAALKAGIDHINSLGGNAFLKADRLAKRFLGALKGMSEVAIYGDIDSPTRLPIVTLNIHGIDSDTLAHRLFSEYQIAVRSGGHCAPLMHKAQGSDQIGAVRFSFSHLNTRNQIDIAIKAIKEIINKRS